MTPPPNTPREATPFAPILDPGALWQIGTVVADQLVDLPNGGQEIAEVAVVTDEPMAVDPISARERVEDGGILAEASHRVRFYWVAGVRPAMRIRMRDDLEQRDRTFEIVSVLNTAERGWLLDLLVVERGDPAAPPVAP
jgi:head-tail adaptor